MIFNTININGTDIYRPNDMVLAREDVYAAEYTTCTGKTIADVIGWKYADTTLEWDTLPDSMMSVLLNMTGENTIIIPDADNIYTEQCIRTGFEDAPTRFTTDTGDVIWKGIKVNISFINTHTL